MIFFCLVDKHPRKSVNVIYGMGLILLSFKVIYQNCIVIYQSCNFALKKKLKEKCLKM